MQAHAPAKRLMGSFPAANVAAMWRYCKCNRQFVLSLASKFSPVHPFIFPSARQGAFKRPWSCAEAAGASTVPAAAAAAIPSELGPCQRHCNLWGTYLPASH